MDAILSKFDYRIYFFVGIKLKKLKIKTFVQPKMNQMPRNTLKNWMNKSQRFNYFNAFRIFNRHWIVCNSRILFDCYLFRLLFFFSPVISKEMCTNKNIKRQRASERLTNGQNLFIYFLNRIQIKFFISDFDCKRATLSLPLKIFLRPKHLIDKMLNIKFKSVDTVKKKSQKKYDVPS